MDGGGKIFDSAFVASAEGSIPRSSNYRLDTEPDGSVHKT
jgi:hypothetical protein